MYVNICMSNVYICIYFIFIYIERERGKRDTERDRQREFEGIGSHNCEGWHICHLQGAPTDWRP